MAKESKIQWTDATWNIARGCTKVDDDCKYCYMYRESLEGTRYEPKTVIRTKSVFNLPLKIKEPSKIFTSSLTDVFHESIDEYRYEAFDIIRRCPHHTFQVLTKRPERIKQSLELAFEQARNLSSNNSSMLSLSVWLEEWLNGNAPKNVWLGTSCGNQKAVEQRIPHLLAAPAHTRFLSAEPLYGPLDLHWYGALGLSHARMFNMNTHRTGYYAVSGLPMLDWIIVGGESGNDNGKYKYRPCELSWIEDIVNQSHSAGIPVFVKQLGTFLAKKSKMSDRHGGTIEEFPPSLQYREFPMESGSFFSKIYTQK